MKHVQHVRGKWIVRITVPPELRDIMGVRELIENDLPNDARVRERMAIPIINRFYAQIDEARELLATGASLGKDFTTAAAQLHYAETLKSDDRKRAAMPTEEMLEAEHQR